MHVRAGLSLLGGHDFEAAYQVAQEAEQLGFDSLWVSDAPLVPAHYPDHFRVQFDPIAFLGGLSAVTSSAWLGTSVLLLTYREILTTAKSFATLQVMSENRLIIGVGSGWRKKEMALFGLDPTTRGRRLDAGLDALDAYFAGETDHAADYGAWNDATPLPAVSQPPQTWIGGGEGAPMRRALRRGRVWHPVSYLGDAPVEGLETAVKEFFDAGGVGFAPRVTIGPEGSEGNLIGERAVVEGLNWLIGMGAHHLSLIFGRDHDEIRANAEWFTTTIRPQLADVTRQVPDGIA